MSSYFRGLALILVLVCICTELSHAAERCLGVALVEVRSLAGLPADLRKKLPTMTHGLHGIADRGGSFNVTDDGVDPDLPMQRFSLAAVGTTCAVVAVEHGGYAHRYELTEYHLAAGKWIAAGSSAFHAEPKTVGDLLVGHQ
jgi:hypothetical protein